MAQKFFQIESGLQLNNSVFLSGTGVPGGTSPTDDVGVGSYYINETTGFLYTKDTAGTGTDKWVKQATQDDIDGVGTGTSWRAPGLVRDNTLRATVADAETAANAADTIDGVTIVSGDRVLLTNFTTGNPNIYTVSGGTGAWTLTEDTSAVDGFTVWIEQGTDADTLWVYDSTTWVQRGSGDQTELGFLRTFVGKTGSGSETPSYSSTNYVTIGNSLETAIGDLDAQVGTNATNIGTNSTNITTLQNEDGFIRTFIGKSASGSETPSYSSTNYVTNGNSLETAIGSLDTQVKVNTDLLASARTEVTSNNVTTQTTVDNVNVDTVSACKWIVYGQGNLEADSAKKYMIEILATHDGHTTGAGADAATADYTSYGKLKIGNLSGFTIVVDVSGTGAGQTMNLKITSTVAADVRVIREVINI
jgi:hypothetical protein